MGFILDIVDLFKQDQAVMYAILAAVLILTLVLVILLTIAIIQGKEVSFLNVKIGSKTENVFKVISLSDACKILDEGVEEYFAWNPSWQTELITSPGEWMDMHLNRYLNKKINRVVYAIFDIKSNRQDRKYFYKQSFSEFINKFLSKNGEQLLKKMESKVEIYVSDAYISDITYFVTKTKHRKYCAVIFINEEPFLKSSVPTKILYTNDETMVRELKSNVESFITNAERVDLRSFIHEERDS